MTDTAIRITHPFTLLTSPHFGSTFRMAPPFREGTDRWISGPSAPASRPAVLLDDRTRRSRQ